MPATEKIVEEGGREKGEEAHILRAGAIKMIERGKRRRRK